MGFQGFTGRYKGFQRVTQVYSGLQGVTGGYKGLQEVTEGFRGLQGVTECYKGLQTVTDGYKGITIGYRVVNNYNIKLFTCASHVQQKVISRLGVARQPHITIKLEGIWFSVSECKIF